MINGKYIISIKRSNPNHTDYSLDKCNTVYPKSVRVGLFNNIDPSSREEIHNTQFFLTSGEVNPIDGEPVYSRIQMTGDTQIVHPIDNTALEVSVKPDAISSQIHTTNHCTITISNTFKFDTTIDLHGVGIGCTLPDSSIYFFSYVDIANENISIFENDTLTLTYELIYFFDTQARATINVLSPLGHDVSHVLSLTLVNEYNDIERIKWRGLPIIDLDKLIYVNKEEFGKYFLVDILPPGDEHGGFNNDYTILVEGRNDTYVLTRNGKDVQGKDTGSVTLTKEEDNYLITIDKLSTLEDIRAIWFSIFGCYFHCELTPNLPFNTGVDFYKFRFAI